MHYLLYNFGNKKYRQTNTPTHFLCVVDTLYFQNQVLQLFSLVNNNCIIYIQKWKRKPTDRPTDLISQHHQCKKRYKSPNTLKYTIISLALFFIWIGKLYSLFTCYQTRNIYFLYIKMITRAKFQLYTISLVTQFLFITFFYL